MRNLPMKTMVACLDLRWKAGHDRAQSFVLTLTLQSNILTETFLLVSCSPTHLKIYCGLCKVKVNNANKSI